MKFSNLLYAIILLHSNAASQRINGSNTQIIDIETEKQIVTRLLEEHNDGINYADDSVCPIDCQGNSRCVRGEADYGASLGNWSIYLPFLSDTDHAGFYCECPVGRTGLLCEREYVSCGDNEHYCFHKGRCLPPSRDAFGNEKHYCDCSDASFNGKRHAGKFCESQSVDVCETSTQKDTNDIFCVDGGTCKSDFKENLEQPCICDEKHEGPHCEYNIGENPTCTLQCFNGGACLIGIKNYDPFLYYNDFWSTHQDYMHCQCPKGYFGLQCEIKGESCGDHHCFHDSTCITQKLSDGTTRDDCDCNTASAGDSKVAGRYCEAESTSFCSLISDHNGHQFCVNGGTCKSESYLGCDCLEGFNGPICEFHDAHQVKESCNLKCENNGVCRSGAKDVSFLENFGIALQSNDQSYSNEFEHCVCPHGYNGLRCEYMADVCPGGQHACLNGGACIPRGKGKDLHFECKCDDARSIEHGYTGDYCEIPSTEFCAVDGKAGKGESILAYCANGGTCKEYFWENEIHPGCDCQIGFEGPNCEIAQKLDDDQNKVYDQISVNDKKVYDQTQVKNDKKVYDQTQVNNDNKFKFGVAEIVMLVFGVDLLIICIFFAVYSSRKIDKNADDQLTALYNDYPAKEGGSSSNMDKILPINSLKNTSLGSRRNYTDTDFENCSQYTDESVASSTIEEQSKEDLCAKRFENVDII